MLFLSTCVVMLRFWDFMEVRCGRNKMRDESVVTNLAHHENQFFTH